MTSLPVLLNPYDLPMSVWPTGRTRFRLFVPGLALRKVWERLANEEADREAWLAGIQKRLGLITTENLLELEIIKDRRLAGG